MSQLTQHNYTQQTVSIKTDRFELKAFVHQLLELYNGLEFNIVSEFVKRELKKVMARMYKSIINPNKKNIKSFTFNFYEILAIKYLQENTYLFFMPIPEFDLVYWKIDSKFRGMKPTSHLILEEILNT